MMAPPAAFAAACRRRLPLREGGTDALRLLDGAGDGATLGGLIIDDFAGRWLVQTSGRASEPPEWLRAVEPAPQAIYWKRLEVRDKAAAVHWAGERVETPFTVREHGLCYQVDFQAGYSQGIFLDQRDNRHRVRQRSAGGAGILNCFAYTCAFSVCAAAGGAATVSIDLSRRSLDWGRENFRLNGLATDDAHAFISGDVFAWLRRFAKQGRLFSGIVLDPPTFSRNRDGQVFRAADDFGRLIELATPLLEAGGWLLCTANQRSVDGEGFRRMVARALPAARRRRIESAPMPRDFTGEQYLQSVWVL